MSDRTQSQVKADISKFLKENGIMTLATQSSLGPWLCTLYYGIDSGLNLYIVTDPRTSHAKNMDANGKVAFNIFDTHQKITKPKKGLQGAGVGALLKGEKPNKVALKLWHKQNPGIESKITIKDIMAQDSDTKIYKITPTFIKFFNNKLYHPHESATWQA